MKVQEPEWIITTYDSSKKQHVEVFKNLFAQREEIDSMMLLFDYNSYYISVDGRFFIINGGRRIQPRELQILENPIILYARRHTKTISVSGNSEPTDTLTYLLGVEGIVDGEKKELFLQISQDGRFWAWRNVR